MIGNSNNSQPLQHQWSVPAHGAQAALPRNQPGNVARAATRAAVSQGAVLHVPLVDTFVLQAECHLCAGGETIHPHHLTHRHATIDLQVGWFVPLGNIHLHLPDQAGYMEKVVVIPHQDGGGDVLHGLEAGRSCPHADFRIKLYFKFSGWILSCFTKVDISNSNTKNISWI